MDVSSAPLISVIVPFHNSATTIAGCLMALERQADPGFEVVVVDDASTDEGPGIAAAICDRAGFSLIRLHANKGQAVARNVGVRHSTGSLLAFVDADVMVGPGWLAFWREMMTADGAPDAVCGGYDISTGEPPAALFASHEAFFRRLNLRSPRLTSLTTASCVLRRSAFEAAGGFPEYYIDPRGDTSARKAVASNEDSELGFLMSRMGYEIRWTDLNPVHHFFRDTWKGYMRQQWSFAWSGTVSVFRFPGILFADDLYSGERIVPQLVAVSLLLVSPVGMLSGARGTVAALLLMAGCLLFFAAYHGRFFRYLGRDGLGGYGRGRVFLWMLAARFVWIAAVASGVVDGVRMRWHGRGIPAGGSKGGKA